VPSTPEDPSLGFMNGVRKIALRADFDVRQVWAACHGTTGRPMPAIGGRFAARPGPERAAGRRRAHWSPFWRFRLHRPTLPHV